MASKQATIMSQVQTDCCSATGITCNGSYRVIGISWSNLGLDGTIYSTLPDTVVNLDLSLNQLTGPLPAIPPGLATLVLNGNKLTGDLNSARN